jgi:integrase/recombinase XerD
MTPLLTPAAETLLQGIPPAPPSLPPVMRGMPREEALAWLSRLYDNAEAGHVPPSDDELLAAWLPVCSRSGSAETVAAYSRILRKFRAWLSVTYPAASLRQVDPIVADAWVRWMREQVDRQEIAARTFNQAVAALSSFYGWTADPARSGWSGVPRNPLPRRPYLSVGKTRKALTEPDLDLILGAVRTAAQTGSTIAQRDYVLLRTLYLLGLRASEAAALRWGDIEMLPDGTGKVTVTGKGSKTRAVKISAETLALFESIPGGRQSDEDWLFPSRRRPGHHLSRQALNSRVGKWGRAVGIHAYCHKLRHSHITIANRRGCDVFTLMASVGHSGAQTTSAYITLDPTDSSSLRLG